MKKRSTCRQREVNEVDRQTPRRLLKKLPYNKGASLFSSCRSANECMFIKKKKRKKVVSDAPTFNIASSTEKCAPIRKSPPLTRSRCIECIPYRKVLAERLGVMLYNSCGFTRCICSGKWLKYCVTNSRFQLLIVFPVRPIGFIDPKNFAQSWSTR